MSPITALFVVVCGFGLFMTAFMVWLRYDLLRRKK